MTTGATGLQRYSQIVITSKPTHSFICPTNSVMDKVSHYKQFEFHNHIEMPNLKTFANTQSLLWCVYILALRVRARAVASLSYRHGSIVYPYYS